MTPTRERELNALADLATRAVTDPDAHVLLVEAWSGADRYDRAHNVSILRNRVIIAEVVAKYGYTPSPDCAAAPDALALLLHLEGTP